MRWARQLKNFSSENSPARCRAGTGPFAPNSPQTRSFGTARTRQRSPPLSASIFRSKIRLQCCSTQAGDNFCNNQVTRDFKNDELAFPNLRVHWALHSRHPLRNTLPRYSFKGEWPDPKSIASNANTTRFPRRIEPFALRHPDYSCEPSPPKPGYPRENLRHLAWIPQAPFSF